MPAQPGYEIVIGQEILTKIRDYHEKLKQRPRIAGKYLKDQILKSAKNISIHAYLQKIDTETFIELLINSKQPVFFAETELKADGSDWNIDETQILNGIVFVARAQAYENGGYGSNAISYGNTPQDSIMLYTPAPMLAVSQTLQTLLPEHLEIIEWKFNFYSETSQQGINKEIIGTFNSKANVTVTDAIDYLKNQYEISDKKYKKLPASAIADPNLITAIRSLGLRNILDVQINQKAFQEYYRKNYLPVLFKINADLEELNKGKKDEERILAVNYIPGLGCGNFAGWFAGSGKIEYALIDAFNNLIDSEKLPEKLNNFQGIYFAPYKEPETPFKEPTGTDRFFNWKNRDYKPVKNSKFQFLVRPTCNIVGKEPKQSKSAFDKPEVFQSEFKSKNPVIVVVSIAADQESWLCNDYFKNNNAALSQEGFTASKTNVMTLVTRALGKYVPRERKYLPIEANQNLTWEDIVYRDGVKLVAKDNVWVTKQVVGKNKKEKSYVVEKLLPNNESNQNTNNLNNSVNNVLWLINQLYLHGTISEEDYIASFDAAGDLAIPTARVLTLIFKSLQIMIARGEKIIDPFNPLYIKIMDYFKDVVQSNNENVISADLEQLKQASQTFFTKFIKGALKDAYPYEEHFCVSINNNACAYLANPLSEIDAATDIKPIVNYFIQHIRPISTLRPLFLVPSENMQGSKFILFYLQNILSCLKALLELDSDLTKQIFSKLVEALLSKYDDLVLMDISNISNAHDYNNHINLFLEILNLYDSFPLANNILSQKSVNKLAAKVMHHQTLLLVSRVLLNKGRAFNPNDALTTYAQELLDLLKLSDINLGTLKSLLMKQSKFVSYVFSTHQGFFKQLNNLSEFTDCRQLSDQLKQIANFCKDFSQDKIACNYFAFCYHAMFMQLRSQLHIKFKEQDVTTKLDLLLNAMVKEIASDWLAKDIDHPNFLVLQMNYTVDSAKWISGIDKQVEQLTAIDKVLQAAADSVNNKNLALLASALADAQAVFYDAPRGVNSAFRVLASALVIAAIALGITFAVLSIVGIPLLTTVSIAALVNVGYWAIGAAGGGLVGLLMGLGINCVYLNRSANHGLMQDDVCKQFLEFKKQLEVTVSNKIDGNLSEESIDQNPNLNNVLVT